MVLMLENIGKTQEPSIIVNLEKKKKKKKAKSEC